MTGAAQGIGACTAAAFAAEGARVMLADTNAAFGERRRREIERVGGKAWFVRADVGSVPAVRKMVCAAVRRLGGLDVLVNNVGIGSGAGLLKRKPADWQRVINTNLGGAYHASQIAAPYLIRSRGSIVSIASSRAIQSEADTEPYSASKGGVLALTHSLAVTLSGKVRVNTVLPGWIDTTKWHYDGMKWDLTKEDHAQHPAGRVGVPEDIAAAVLFLCSSEAGFITGQKLVVDGGMTVKMQYLE